VATVGAVYTVDPYVRTAEDVVAALFLDPDYKPVPRPEPAHKRVWASLPREGAAPQSSIEVVFDWLWWEFAQRNPQLKRPTVSLCDSPPRRQGSPQDRCLFGSAAGARRRIGGGTRCRVATRGVGCSLPP
jgi:hypothetical protein